MSEPINFSVKKILVERSGDAFKASLSDNSNVTSYARRKEDAIVDLITSFPDIFGIMFEYVKIPNQQPRK